MTDGILRSFSRYSFTSTAPSPVLEETPITDFLLDDYPNAKVGYSIRKLRSAYAGSAVRIRRSSDNAEADIGFTAGGHFDVTAAAAHIGGGSGFVVTWYDQSGSGFDLVQGTAGSQPTYSAIGIGSAGRPSATFDGSDDSLAETFDLGTFGEATVFSAMSQAAATATNSLFFSSNLFGCHATYSDVIYFDFNGSGGSSRINVAQPSGWDDNPHVLELYRDSSDEQGIVVDGVSLITGTRTDDYGGTNLFSIGDRGGAGINHGGSVSELVVWTTDLGSTDRAGARTNINDYYGVF